MGGLARTFPEEEVDVRPYLKDALLVHADKVQGFVDEAVAQRLEQTLHQRHAEAVDPRPARCILGLTGETLLRDIDHRFTRHVTEHEVKVAVRSPPHLGRSVGRSLVRAEEREADGLEDPRSCHRCCPLEEE